MVKVSGDYERQVETAKHQMQLKLDQASATVRALQVYLCCKNPVSLINHSTHAMMEENLKTYHWKLKYIPSIDTCARDIHVNRLDEVFSSFVDI